jgi:Uma2 family endonuclease
MGGSSAVGGAKVQHLGHTFARMITSISQLDPQATYTYADYLAWKFEERVELLRGRIAQMAAPSRVHQRITRNLFTPISNALWRNSCEVYPAPFDVRLTHFSNQKNRGITTVVQPDICVVCDPTKLDDRGCAGLGGGDTFAGQQ